MATPRSLLELYIQAKDSVQPQLMRQIYVSDATLTYSIATDSISFPARTAGLDAITRTLIIDFATKFGSCKTYYVCEAAPLDDSSFARVPWLVVMREPAAASLRIGKGYYEWRFAPAAAEATRVTAMHIHIERMDAILDPDGSRLIGAQSALPYPWLQPSTLRSTYRRCAEEDPAFAFLHEFEMPLDLSAS
jgi:hypothetical protein